MGYLKNKPGSLEAISAKAIGMPEARSPEQQRTHDKMMKDFLAKGGKIQKIPAGKKTDPNKLKKGIKEEVELTESTDINFNPPVDMNKLKKYGTFSGETAGGMDRFFTLKGNNQRMFVIKKAGKIGTLKITAGNRGQDSDKQVKAMAKDLRYKIIDDGDADYNMKKEDAEHFGISGIEVHRPEHLDEDGIPPIAKDNKPGVKIAKIRATRDKKEDGSKGDTESLKQQIGVLRQKLEIEKQKAVKPQPNKDTGEVPLTIGVAYKHLKDKAAKEDKKDEKEPDIKKEAVEPKKENKKIQAKNKADKQKKIKEAMPGGANSSSKKGPVWKAWKAAQRKRRRKLNNSNKVDIDKQSVKTSTSDGKTAVDGKGTTMTGKPKNKVDLNPRIDYSR